MTGVSAYDPALLYFAIGAMRARIETGAEFKLRDLWRLGNLAAGWPEFDDQTPCFKESWNLVNEYRQRALVKSRKRKQSRIWRYVG